MFYKKSFLKNLAIFLGKHLCWSLFLKNCRPSVLQVYWKETLTQVFSCAYCELLKKIYFEKHMQTAASDYSFTLAIYLFSAVSLMIKKMFIGIGLCNPMTYVFKRHMKIVKIYLVKFNVSILNRLKIMGFFCKFKVYT